MLRGDLETEISFWGPSLGVFWGNAFPSWQGLAGMVARSELVNTPRAEMLLLSYRIHGNSTLGREGSSQRRVFTIVCRGTGAGIPHLPQVFGEPQILSEECECSGCLARHGRKGRSVGWNPLSQQPFPAPAGLSSWPIQLGFPCALSLFQLPQLWQLIPSFHSPLLGTSLCSSALTARQM